MIHDIETLPPEITDPSAWYGPEMSRRTDWIYQLSDSEIAEIESAVIYVARNAFDLAAIRQNNFLLPKFGATLQTLLTEVLNGRGFVLIRGLPAEDWTDHKTAMAFLGIGGHLGNLRS